MWEHAYDWSADAGSPMYQACESHSKPSRPSRAARWSWGARRVMSDAELDKRLARIEQLLTALVERQQIKEFYAVDEFARLAGRTPFTVREWCRQHRINAEKRSGGRGAHCTGSFVTTSFFGSRKRACFPGIRLSRIPIGSPLAVGREKDGCSALASAQSGVPSRGRSRVDRRPSRRSYWRTNVAACDSPARHPRWCPLRLSGKPSSSSGRSLVAHHGRRSCTARLDGQCGTRVRARHSAEPRSESCGTSSLGNDLASFRGSRSYLLRGPRRPREIARSPNVELR